MLRSDDQLTDRSLLPDDSIYLQLPFQEDVGKVAGGIIEDTDGDRDAGGRTGGEGPGLTGNAMSDGGDEGCDNGGGCVGWVGKNDGCRPGR